MKKRLLLTLPLLLFVMVGLFFYHGLHQDPYRIPSVMINRETPDISSPLLLHPDQQFSNKQLIGKVSLLNVWASWCVSCKEEHATLMAIAASHKVALYGLNYKDAPQAAKQMLQQRGDPYQLIATDVSGHIGINLGVYGTPETFLIDKTGVIRDKVIGPITMAAWQYRLLPEIEKYQRL